MRLCLRCGKEIEADCTSSDFCRGCMREMWNQAEEIARENYEEAECESWDEADKYAREDYHFDAFSKLQEKYKKKMLELFHKKSILDCETEEEQEIHAKEVEDFLKMVYKMPNRICVFAYGYLDEGNSHKGVKFELGELHEFEEMLVLGAFDFKNGVDFAMYHGRPVCTIYGQTYEYKGETFFIIQRIIAM